MALYFFASRSATAPSFSKLGRRRLRVFGRGKKIRVASGGGSGKEMPASEHTSSHCIGSERAYNRTLVKPHPRRWLMIALAFLATVINYLDRQTLSVAAPVLREQFHMSNVDYSRVVFAFMLAYTIMNGASGPLIDRLGTRLGYALCMRGGRSPPSCTPSRAAPSSLGAFRFLLGMGEAGNWPAAVKVVAEWFPERNARSPPASSTAAPRSARSSRRRWWRSSLLQLRLAAAFVVVGARRLRLARLLVADLSHARGAAIRHTPTPARRCPSCKLLRMRFVWSFTISKIFLDPVWYFYIFWFPEYLKTARHFDMASIGKFAWIPFAVAGVGNFSAARSPASCCAAAYRITVARKVVRHFLRHPDALRDSRRAGADVPRFRSRSSRSR